MYPPSMRWTGSRRSGEWRCGSWSSRLSSTLGFVMGGRTDIYPTPAPAAAINSDDVLDMHQLLATWRGDLAGLLGQVGPARSEASR